MDFGEESFDKQLFYSQLQYVWRISKQVLQQNKARQIKGYQGVAYQG